MPPESQSTQESESNLEEVRKILSEAEARFRKVSSKWKNAYRCSLVAATMLSSASAVTGKLSMIPEASRADVAALLATFATILTTVIAALDFETNARVNRRARNETAILLLESRKSLAKKDDLLGNLQKILKQRSDDVNNPD